MLLLKLANVGLVALQHYEEEIESALKEVRNSLVSHRDIRYHCVDESQKSIFIRNQIRAVHLDLVKESCSKLNNNAKCTSRTIRYSTFRRFLLSVL
jgi:hypothetical protein